MINVQSESEFLHEYNRVRVIGIVDNLSLKVTDRDVKNIGQAINNLRVGILQMLFLERFYEEEVNKKQRLLIL